MNNLLFVCEANICRSPMAEGLFGHYLGQSVKVQSAGMHALVGRPAAESAQVLMKEKGIDISEHRAKQVTDSMIFSSDLILVMENDQKRKIEFIFPHSRGRVHLLGKWSQCEIPDPYHLPISVYQHTLDLIEKAWLDWKVKF